MKMASYKDTLPSFDEIAPSDRLSETLRGGIVGVSTDQDPDDAPKPSGAIKLDAGKLPVMRGVFLRFPRAMYELARVSLAGTTKYAVPIDDMEYRNVPDGEGRYTEALGRHLLDEVIHGPMNTERGGALPDEGVQLMHAAQAAWDALARLEIRLTNMSQYKEPTT